MGRWCDLLVDEPSNTRPATLDAVAQARIRDLSFETRLVAQHLGASRKDINIFDHERIDGHNAMRGPAGNTALPVHRIDRGSDVDQRRHGERRAASGALAMGQVAAGAGVAPNTVIVAGRRTSWTVSAAQTVSLHTLTASGWATRDRRYYPGAINH